MRRLLAPPLVAALFRVVMMAYMGVRGCGDTVSRRLASGRRFDLLAITIAVDPLPGEPA